MYKCRNLMKNFESKINKWIIKKKLTTHIHVHVATCIKVNVNHTLISSIPQYMNYFTDPRRFLKEQCTCRCKRFRFELKFNFYIGCVTKQRQSSSPVDCVIDLSIILQTNEE